MKKWLLSVLILSGAVPGWSADLDFREAARIVIQADGRKKPLDTFASESLQTISGRRTFRDTPSGERIGAMDALFSMWFGTRDWRKVPVVLVADPSLRRELGLAAAERFFSLETLLANSRLDAIRGRLARSSGRNQELTLIEKEAEIVLIRMHLLDRLISGESLTIVPNAAGTGTGWLAPGFVGAVDDKEAGRRIAAVVQALGEAYRVRDRAKFTDAARQMRESLEKLDSGQYPSLSVINREIHYNHIHPFRWAWIFYTAAFFALLLVRNSRPGQEIFLTGLALHVYGLVLRCWIAGRAPVTNMYESVVWVSLGAAAFALILGLIYRARIYLLTAAPLAVLGLILADAFPSLLDPSIRPLPPVLRDNFWLVTHVLTITLGYSAFFVAMGMGHLILIRYLVFPKSVDERSQVHELLYRVLQIGVLLLAAGTILGGIWANYSWGRFWGWDPKETWALIALLLYIFAIHGRMAGWWGNFGLSVAAAVCFHGVVMAWYGVNFVLGKGLHSYGFGGGGAGWVGALVAVDVLFVGLCIGARVRRLRHAEGILPANALKEAS